MLKKTDAQEVYHIENIQISSKKPQQERLKNISEQEKDILIQGEYITQTDAQYINIREITYDEFSKLVWQLPRGNDEAEAWFRKQMAQK